VLVVENFLLIALDPKHGTATLPRRSPRLEKLCAASLLVDLAEVGHLALHGDSLQADLEFPVTHPLLEQALGALGEQSRPTAAAIDAIAKRMSSLPARVADVLVRRDVLHRVRPAPWIFTRTSYPLRSVQARNSAIESLRTAAHARQTDLPGLTLLMLFDVAGLLPKFLDARDHEAAEARLMDLNTTHEQASETLRVLAAVRKALLDG
jgi:Golgi phosphoprotein 3 (GPP34)